MLATKVRLTPAALFQMTRPQLEALYSGCEPGPIPDGPSKGLASIAPGTPAGEKSERFFHFFWKGKIFNREAGTLVNDVLIGKTVKAKVFVADSWFDGKPAIIIDYKAAGLSQLAWLSRPVRDEIRLAAPDVYLGFAYIRSVFGKPGAPLLFALDFAKT